MFRLRRLHLSGDKSDVYANYDRYSGRAVDYQCLPSTDQVLEPQCDFGEGFTGAEHLRVYGWYLRELPPSVPAAECVNCNGLTLLYIGIAPRPPAKNGSISSRTLRTRLRQHYALNAEGSTLRLTLGCLLAQQLGIELRRVGSGQRMTFGAGEHVLSTWMDGKCVRRLAAASSTMED
jgi:hypothetical protein